MFLESHLNHPMQSGTIEVICGSMFSGKTEELLRRLKRANFAKLKVEIYKPKIDTRYDSEKIVSHDENTVSSVVVKNSSDILNLINNPDIVAIDEAQFFTDNLSNVCNILASKGIRVIVAGLDMDFLGNPFGEIPKLLAIAEHVTKVHAICLDCGSIANHSFRTSKNNKLVSLGAINKYKPLCRKCFNKNKTDV
ncbi:MAG: thymidine kinase [Flavobacteriales bacterium]|tara:strand:+ start:4573 stop:5154 length:582 start_codon:yes stop_codon:yes gene_type:complete